MEETLISVDRYVELLLAEVKLNMIKDMCESGEYVSIADVKRIISLGGKVNKND